MTKRSSGEEVASVIEDGGNVESSRGTELLHRFSDPDVKRRRVEKKVDAEREKKKLIMSIGKVFAKNCYNDITRAPDEWREHHQWPESLPSDDADRYIHLRDLYRHMKPGVVENRVREMAPAKGRGSQKADPGSIFACLTYFQVAEDCTKWLDDELKRIGWKKNMTDYDPVAVSGSSAELYMAHAECARMAYKQAALLCEQGSVADW